MQFEDFRRIVTCFADSVDDVDASRGELLVQIRDETIAARLHQRPDGLIVDEEGERQRATTWIVNRIARLPLLADRICSYVSPPPHFVKPSGGLLDRPDREPSDEDSFREDAAAALSETLDRRPAGTTSVLYLTSDAGEGKTSLIDHLAVERAKAYKTKRSDWLLVPIPLGGRTFLRFDDVVVSALVNRLRFQLLYYDAFLELVRLGVLVPAFDGFEEMIVEASSGEAVSALGNLVGSLRSAGTLLVAARKAYFDYPSFRSQATLFDAIGTGGNVEFGRVSLNRWKRGTFIRYARARGVGAPEEIFDAVAKRLDDEHPLLTRAVLVRRLVDVAEDGADLDRLLERIGADPQDYFHEFVDGLVRREAETKWVDTAGDPPRALLTTEEHHELLAMVAHEMWLSATDELKLDVVGILVQMFADAKSPSVARQIGERIKQHALLVRNGSGRAALSFDHDDFRLFYFGRALGRILAEGDLGEMRSVLEKADLPASAVAEAVGVLRRRGANRERQLVLLQRLADGEMPASFVRENCGTLTLALLDGVDGSHAVRNMSFPADALRRRRLRNVSVTGSWFHATSLAKTALHGCRFENCDFERLEMDGSETVSGSSFDDCRVGSVVRLDAGDQIARFAPDAIAAELRRAGLEIEPAAPTEAPATEALAPEEPPDDDMRVAQRFLRAFLRSNALNESTTRQRLGVNANRFFRYLLPALLQAGVVQEVPYQGHGAQKRMKLAAPMARIEEALSAAGGRFDDFVQAFGSAADTTRRHSH